MKDREARQGLIDQRFDLKEQQKQIAGLAAQIAELRAAYDALFDVVASDLGYQAQAAPSSPGFYMPESCRRRASPRTFEMTRPPAAERVRTQANIRLFPKKAT